MLKRRTPTPDVQPDQNPGADSGGGCPLQCLLPTLVLCKPEEAEGRVKKGIEGFAKDGERDERNGPPRLPLPQKPTGKDPCAQKHEFDVSTGQTGDDIPGENHKGSPPPILRR